MTNIYNLLYQLGLTANYTGFFYTACAMKLCVDCPERLRLVTKWLYPEVAKQYGTNWRAVERNIRAAGTIIWNKNRSLLEQMAAGEQNLRPAQMLSILIILLEYSPPTDRTGLFPENRAAYR